MGVDPIWDEKQRIKAQRQIVLDDPANAEVKSEMERKQMDLKAMRKKWWQF